MNPSPSYFHRLFQICVKEMEERTKKYTVNVLRNIQRDPKDTSENAFMLPLSDLLHFFCVWNHYEVTQYVSLLSAQRSSWDHKCVYLISDLKIEQKNLIFIILHLEPKS